MADYSSKIKQASNKVGDALGLVGAYVGAYTGVPQAAGNEGYLKQAATVGNWNFDDSSMEGLLGAYNSMPALHNITAEDLYNPSEGEMFGSLFGGGMAAYGAMANLTKDLKGKMGGTYINGGSGVNTQTNQGWGELSKKNLGDLEDLMQNPISDRFGLTKKACGGHLHGCGGHKFEDGGVFMDHGSAVGTALNLLSGGVGVGLGFAGIKNQQELAKARAAEVNAANLYAQQMMHHNFGEALFDTKNNMYNQQALQMMAMGGDLQAFGGNFPLPGEFNVIGAGGTHENNPLGGVYQGMASDGKPNLVEEGEVVWDSYVFSNRIGIPSDFAKTYKLKEGITYAEAAKKFSKESEDRPNDPISKESLDEELRDLMESQEAVKAQQEAAQVKKAISKMSPEEVMNMMAMLEGGQPYAYGGLLGHTFSGEQSGSSKMDKGQARLDALDKELYEKRLSQLSIPELMWLASRQSGYNKNDYGDLNAKKNLIKFLAGKRTSSYGYNNLVKDIEDRQNLRTLTKDELPEFGNKKMTPAITQDAWDKLIGDMKSYKGSKQPSKGGKTYKIDPDFKYNNKSVAEIEEDANFRDFRDYITDQIDKYSKGEDIDPNVLRFLEAYDSGIDTSNGAPTLLQYNEDGTVKKENGRVMLNPEFKEQYNKIASDALGGIGHHYTKVGTPREVGSRDVYRIKDDDGNWAYVNAADVSDNPFIETLRTEDVVDENGNTTHYITLGKKQYSEEANEEEEETKKNKDVDLLPTGLRYAPVAGSALGALMAATEDPRDYSTAITPDRAEFATIGDYLPYTPIDTQRYINAENQQAAAQLNAIMNASAGNRNMALAQAALANQQRQQAIGQRMAAAEQINWDRLGKAGEFNRGTNMFNAQAFNTAEQANLHNNPLLLHQAQQNAAMRHAVDAERDAAISQNLTALFENLGNVGKENFYMNQANTNEALRYGIGRSGGSHYKGCGGRVNKKQNKNRR